MYELEYESPVGVLLLQSCGEALTGLWMNRRESISSDDTPPVLYQAALWLDDYFRGNPRPADFPLAPEGTPFQKQIWSLLLEIPYGSVCSYGELARRAAERMGRERMSSQAVGGAVGRNPISVIIPCHRVIGASGSLTGYAGGLEKKQWLLLHEGWKPGQKP